MKPAPCLDCLIIPICRQRYFVGMKNKCKLVEKYLFKPPSFMAGRVDFDFRVNRVYDAIRPVHWKKRYPIDTHYLEHRTQEFLIGSKDRRTVMFWKEVV